MERGRSSGVGVGGARGFVAGVRAALTPRGNSGLKSRSRSRTRSEEEVELEEINEAPSPPLSGSNSKTNKGSKSPFIGWRKSKSRESTKSKTKTKTKEPPREHGRNDEGLRACSQHQAERLSAHISDDYTYSTEAFRDIRTGTYTSFGIQGDPYERKLSSDTTNSSSSFGGSDRVKCRVDTTSFADRPVTFSKTNPFSDDVARYVSLPLRYGGDLGVRKESKGVDDGVISFYGEEERTNCIGEESSNCIINFSDGNGEIYNHREVLNCQPIVFDNSKNHIDSESDIASGGGNRIGDGVENWMCDDDFMSSGNVNLGFQNYSYPESSNEFLEVEEERVSGVRVRGDGSDCHKDEAYTEGKPESENRDENLRNIISNADSIGESGRGYWLKSALSYNIEFPETPRNEIAILALGIDQYIEEVFKHLDYLKIGKVSAEDFVALCHVLGLSDTDEECDKKISQKCQCSGSNLTLHGTLNGSLGSLGKGLENKCPLHLSFGEFHDKLCEKFVRGSKTENVVPLANRRTKNERLVTSVVSVQRRYDLLESISRSLAEVSAGLDSDEARMVAGCPASKVICCKCRQAAHIDRNSNIASQPLDAEWGQLKKQVLLQQEELQCLREVIEDMRIALQSSDAENLALQVKSSKDAKSSRSISYRDLCLTDEEDTIDDLVRQLTELSRPANKIVPETCDLTNTQETTQPLPSQIQQRDTRESSESSENPLNTALLSMSGDFSLEAELQSTYEALHLAREEQEATQADLQRTVGQLQEREEDLRGAELNLQAAHTVLEKVQYDNHALVLEVAEARRTLDETRCRLTAAWEDLQQAKETLTQKEKQLQEAQARLQLMRNSRERIVEEVTSTRELVAQSLDQVRAGELAIASLASLSPHSPSTPPTRLDATCRTDSGLYSEDSERDEDMKTSDRSGEQISASEDDLWSSDSRGPSKQSLNDGIRDNHMKEEFSSSSSSSCSAVSSPCSPSPNITDNSESKLPIAFSWLNNGKTKIMSSTEVIEGLEREVQWLQYTLNEAERDWIMERQYLSDDSLRAKEEAGVLEDELRQVEAERVRLSLIEDKLRQLLQVLLSLADLNLSRRTLGRLVLEALEDASGLKLGDVSAAGIKDMTDISPLDFLTKLLTSTSSYQTLSTESLIQLALQGLTYPPPIPELPEPLEATLG